jgi:hypothetical protein
MPSSVQQNVINALRALGATIELDDEGDAVSLEWGRHTPVLEGGLMLMLELDTLTRVTLFDMNDIRLGYVGKLPNLRGLDIPKYRPGFPGRESHISDAGLVHLRELRRLEFLILGSEMITLDGLKNLTCQDHLKYFDGPEHLRLDYVELFPSVETVYRFGTTDAELAHVKNLRHIRELGIQSP